MGCCANEIPHDPIVDAPGAARPAAAPRTLVRSSRARPRDAVCAAETARARRKKLRRSRNAMPSERAYRRLARCRSTRPATVDPRAASLPMSPSTVQRDPSPHHEMLETSEFPRRARRSARGSCEADPIRAPAGRAIRLPAGVRFGQRAAAPGAAVSAREWYWTR
ncbi:hornerin-like [Iris pallida]|uniref:Hornerin-like n=1 Tax=Iris pallida TaxID=29817 RepID=A0AAX6GI74_IRIPA|nr:hornerin-like [Iris pallida]